MVKHDWIVLKYDVYPNQLICERCNQKMEMPQQPIPINVYMAMLKAFGKDHKKCKVKQNVV